MMQMLKNGFLGPTGGFQNGVPFFQPDKPEVAPYFFDAIKHSTDDAYWQKFSIQNKYDKVGVAVLALRAVAIYGADYVPRIEAEPQLLF